MRTYKNTTNDGLTREKRAAVAQELERQGYTRVNVEEAFYDLVREIRRTQPGFAPAESEKKKKPKSGGCSLL